MNDAFTKKAEKLALAGHRQVDSAKKYALMKNMDILFHRFDGLDTGTLQYFSVFGLALNDSDYRIVLFYADAPATPLQESGEAVFDQAFLYAVIQEEIDLALTGRANFWSTELDGRVAVLINFANKVIPPMEQRMHDMICNFCQEVCGQCQSKYDIDVYAICSPLLHGYQRLSWAYYCLDQEIVCRQFLGANPDTPLRFSSLELYAPGAAKEQVCDQLASTCARMIYQQRLPDSTLLESYAKQYVQSLGVLFSNLESLNRAMNSQLLQLGVLHSAETSSPEFFWVHSHASSFSILLDAFADYSRRLIKMAARRTQSIALQRVEQVKTIVEKRYSDSSLSLPGIAAELGVSASTLAKQFRNTAGSTFAVYLQNYRLEQARSLLFSNDETIESVCQTCGFGCTETMYRLFREHFKKTPNQIRREQKRYPSEPDSSAVPESQQ